MKIESYISETSRCEKKREVERHKIRHWLKSVSAFANTDGGTLIFGIDDHDVIVGLENAKKDSEFIREKIKERISPLPSIDLRIEKTVDNKEIIFIEVSSGTETPYFCSCDGSTDAYIRIGNESISAPAADLKRLVLRGKETSYDSLVTNYHFNDFAFSKLRERYFAWLGHSMPEKAYESFGIKTTDDYLTNAGLLFADEPPVRHSRLFCTRWSGINKSGGMINALDSAEYTGSLVLLLEEGMRFFRRNSKKMWMKASMSRIELPDYPKRSVFEALVNALIHRDYLIIGSEVHLDIFDDRIEIYSPGGMPDGTLIQDRDIDNVPSVRRNPILADIFARLGFMERQGSGLSKICNFYESEQNYNKELTPTFRSNRVEFTVVMKNLNGITQGKRIKSTETVQMINESGDNLFSFLVNPRRLPSKDVGAVNQPEPQTEPQTDVQLCDAILNEVSKSTKITKEELAKKFNVSLSSIKRVVKNLGKQERLRYVGFSKNGHWEVTN